MIDGVVIVFQIGFFYGSINNNKIDNWINQNVVILGKTCFGIFVGGFGLGKVFMSRQLYVMC